MYVRKPSVTTSKHRERFSCVCVVCVYLSLDNRLIFQKSLERKAWVKTQELP